MSIAVQGTLAAKGDNFVIVDDIVTRGATILGCANRLLEAFPEANVAAFAAIRTMSDPDTFVRIIDPRVGRISYREAIDDTLRRA